jgi:hypothetical protein
LHKWRPAYNWLWFLEILITKIKIVWKFDYKYATLFFRSWVSSSIPYFFAIMYSKSYDLKLSRFSCFFIFSIVGFWNFLQIYIALISGPNCFFEHCSNRACRLLCVQKAKNTNLSPTMLFYSRDYSSSILSVCYYNFHLYFWIVFWILFQLLFHLIFLLLISCPTLFPPRLQNSTQCSLISHLD